MALITPDEGASDLSDVAASVERQLRDMRGDLEDLQTKLKTNDYDDLPTTKLLRTEIRQWLKLAIEAEVHLEQRKKTETGIAGGYALDLDAARDSIGGRLDRLRRARGAD